ncbi:UDP-2,4-diacetamido-2,4,6-trideoxy-beta-L-altropyranose hydrolase [Chitinophaga sp. GCM10012297]|uniref:UDP-2,4-diacetamido-2,4, 6-trideoxy-beta-L-altropyranose hydrolase n=1 Tax=Chitinophaga chungangae TaxID=2821488 RepID=A0ABS3YF34_9BACT|nr:UDP-2,4-diacetamido-2,4,6-trideoxy-beta-L-altropyranose hydrolase [Chitinophaga chungangae]MBO9153290.1 UDP-2,4-diacetamido-2,4,6-trideoxy-beta-L-altropyranose hydrolase [Chitinophaga chungangae]
MGKQTKILFRCDGGPQIGLGHVIRNCALAQMLRGEFDCRFYIRNPSKALWKYVEDAGFPVMELPETDFETEAKDWAEQLDGNEILVLDGYSFNTRYQQLLKTKGNKLVCIDDIHAYHFVADVVINHAGGLTVQDYSLEPLTRAYLGTAYALLRPSFLQPNGNTAREDAILVSMGGADPKNDTMAVLELLRRKGIAKKCFVVTGSAYLHRDALETYIRKHRLDAEVLQNLDEAAMAALMRKCRYAVCPPSTVSYEYLSLRGELYLRQIADNQKDIYRFFTGEKLAFPLEDIFVEDAETLTQSALQQERFFDGKSPRRLLKLFRQLDTEQRLTLRRVTAADSDTIFEWANEPAVRQHSLNQNAIQPEEHAAWFNNKIIAPDARMYILELEGKPVGQIRFDIDILRSQAAIGYSVDAAFRGRGLGTAVTRLGIAALQAARPDIREIKAVVKNTNLPSMQVFEQLNFLKSDEETIQGQPCHVYLLKLNARP